MDRSQEKRALRAQLENDLGALTPGERAHQSRALVAHLSAWARPQEFDVVLTTLPFAEEPDLGPFLQPWLERGRVGLARTGRGRTMEFHLVSSWEGPWDTKAWGLREPPAGLPRWEPGSNTLCLVPGLAFAPAPQGGALRLGRGAGYYDRWLERFGDRVVTLGVAFAVQVVPTVPVEGHDRVLDGWVDPTGVHGFGAR